MSLSEELLFKFFVKQNCSAVSKHALKKFRNHMTEKFEGIFNFIFYLCEAIDTKRVTKKLISVCIPYFTEHLPNANIYDYHDDVKNIEYYIFTRHDCSIVIDFHLHNSLTITPEASTMFMSFVEAYCNKMANFCSIISNGTVYSNTVRSAIDIIEYNTLEISPSNVFTGKLKMPMIQLNEPNTPISTMSEVNTLSADENQTDNFTNEVENEIRFVMNSIYSSFLNYFNRLRSIFSGYDEYSLIKIAIRYIFPESISVTLNSLNLVKDELYSFDFRGDADFLNSTFVNTLFCTFMTKLFSMCSNYSHVIDIDILHSCLRKNNQYLNIYKKSGIQVFNLLDEKISSNNEELYKPLYERPYLDIFNSSKIESPEIATIDINRKTNFIDSAEHLDEDERFHMISRWMKEKIKNQIFSKILALHN